ncbi:MAG: ribosomal protein S5, nonfunctional [Parcubacteria group bacterium GW2011_GWA2_42_80]|nr:MAG: ribosomal protein S5, nonfunctional [Parcubacteria group bacterium GW2011_GWA2_42_80]KKS92891.1 MAG: ribosomal protein S5, nonfunctional [Parcubacteria group bacterium GW2011_GWE2_43_12]KKT14973.1 MAG: ribosomal protein S5, nonfunctional [Parcubacteria group bacterium GW2011_GWF2_43_38]KKT17285.1 MAG: ribosomal protein S5, nonfunctional [Parcubacteria group bacterium GW2011_GWB1_43_66]
MIPSMQKGRSGRGGGRPGRQGHRDRPDDGFEQRIVELSRVTRVMAGGKRMRFRALVVLGNRQGQVGVGLAKGADVSLAVSKATAKARRALINVPLKNETIPHVITVKYKSANVLLKPAPKGTGIIAGGPVRAVLELAGVPNVVSKILGSSNKVNNVRAVLKAFNLLKLRA